MTGKVNFWHYCDVSLCCVCDHLAQLFLSVVACLGSVVIKRYGWVVHVEILSDNGSGAHAGFLCKFGQGFHLETPALVFRQVPMEAVDAVQGKDVDELLDEGNGEEVTGAVEHRAAIAEAWRTAHPSIGKTHLACLVHNALAKRLYAIEDTARAGSLNGDAFLADVDGIVVGIAALQAKRQVDVGTFLASF